MRFSDVYVRKSFWVLVYHVQPGSDVVELITQRFFDSEKKAWKWFHRKHMISEYVEPEAVMVDGLDQLIFYPTQDNSGE